MIKKKKSKIFSEVIYYKNTDFLLTNVNQTLEFGKKSIYIIVLSLFEDVIVINVWIGA